jgi:hypothetical protein
MRLVAGLWTVTKANTAGRAPRHRRVIRERNRSAVLAAHLENRGRSTRAPCRLTSWVNWCPCHGWCL